MVTTPKPGSGATRGWLLALGACLLVAVLLSVTRPQGRLAALTARLLAKTPLSGVRQHDVDPDVLKVVDLADVEAHSGKFADAESRLRTLLPTTESSHGPNSVEVALILTGLTDTMVRSGRAREDECLAMADRAVRIMESAGDPRLARSLERKGAVLRERGELDDARGCLNRALEFQRSNAVPDTFGVTQTLADIYTEQGLYDEARGLLEDKIAADTARHVNPREVVFSRYVLARLLVRMGEYAEAGRLYDEAIATADGAMQRAFLLNGRAVLHDELGEYPQAQTLYEQAKAAAESVDPNSAIVGSIINNLGYLNRNMGEYAAAEKYFVQAIEFHRNARGEESAQVASSTVNLAGLYCLQGKYAEAEKLYLRALRIREKLFGVDHPHVATSLHDMAELYLKTDRPARAVPLFERALAIHVQKSGRGSVDTWESLAGLAKARDDTGDRKTAGRLYEEALAAIKAVAGNENARCVAAMRNLAWFYDRSDRTPEGLALALEAETLSMEHARLLASSLPDQQALRYSATRADGLNLALSIAADDTSAAVAESVWDVVVRSRALVLDEIAARQRALRFDDPATERAAEAYATASRRLAHLMLLGQEADAAEFSAQLAEARSDRERCERELAAQSASFRALESRRRLGLPEVRSALPPQSALVAFVRFDRWSADLGARGVDESAVERGEVDQEYLAFLLPVNAPVKVVPLGPAAKIDSLIDVWSQAMEHAPRARDRDAARAEYRTAGDALRRVLWDPVAERLESVRYVFIVPDGATYRVSFAALPVAGDRYLVETGPHLHYLGAERDLVAGDSEGARSPEGRGLLAVGGPEFDGISRGSASQRFAPLPATADEARSVTATWQRAMTARPAKASPSAIRRSKDDEGAILLTGVSATEGEVKNRAPGRRVLHFATHGFFLREGRSALPGTRGFGGVVIGDSDAPAVRPANPLELSGLAFAGANRAPSVRPDEEDGILTAEEIAAMNLAGAEWAVLSACETGVGAVQDVEGIVGLRRAFQVAGVRTLIMSLWPVDDRATRTWMEELYRHRLEDDQSTLEAVHEATLAVLSAQRSAGREHPFFWGAFVAAGDWR